jgi:hypothetical protein
LQNPCRRPPVALIDYVTVEALVERLIDLPDQRTGLSAEMEPDHHGKDDTDECPAGNDCGTAYQLSDFRSGGARGHDSPHLSAAFRTYLTKDDLPPLPRLMLEASLIFTTMASVAGRNVRARA